MAGAIVGSLRVVFGLDSAAFEKGISKVDRKMSATQKSLSKMGDRFQSVGKAMSLSITAPLVGLGIASVKAGQEFEKSMASVSTLVDGATESMSGMKDQVLAMAGRLPVPIDELTGALYNVRSAGISAGDAMGVLEKSAKLGVAGLGTTAEAADIATSAINSFGLKGAEADKVYDNVFRTVKAGKTTISELGQGFGAVVPVIAQAGIALDEYLASVAAMTTGGLPAAQAQTQIRAAIAGLTRDSKESAAAFKKLGVGSFKELIDKSGGLVGAFKAIQEKLKPTDAELLKLTGSIEGYNAIIALTGKGNDAFTTTLAGMRSGLNAVDEAFLKQAGTSAAKWQQTQNAMKVAGIQISTALQPALTTLVGLLSQVAQWFGSLTPATQKWLVGLAAVAAAIGPISFGLGTLLKIGAPLLAFMGTFASTIAAAGTVSGAAGAGFAGLSAGLSVLWAALAPLIIPIAALAAAGALIYYNWDKIAPVLAKVADQFKSALGPQIAALQSALTALWEGPLGDLLRGAMDLIGEFADLLISTIGDRLVTSITLAGEIISGLITGIGNVIKIVGQILTGDFAGAFKTAVEAVRSSIGSVLRIIEALVPGAISAMIRMYNGIKTWIQDKLGAVFDGVGKKVEAVKGFFYGLYDAVVGHSYIPDMVDEIGQNMRRLQQELVAPTAKATTEAANAFRQMQQSVSTLFDRLFPTIARMNQLKGETDLLNEAMKRGVISADEYAVALARLKAEGQDDILGKREGPTGLDVGPIAGAMSDSEIEKALERMTDAANKNADGVRAANVKIVDSFKDMVSKTSQSIQDFVGAIKGGGFLDILQAGVNLFMQIGSTGAFGKGMQTRINASGRAIGGNIMAGRTYTVGENGPETFMAASAGKIVPNNGEGRGGRRSELSIRLGPGLESEWLQKSAGQSVQILRAAAPGMLSAASARTRQDAARPITPGGSVG